MGNHGCALATTSVKLGIEETREYTKIFSVLYDELCARDGRKGRYII